MKLVMSKLSPVVGEIGLTLVTFVSSTTPNTDSLVAS